MTEPESPHDDLADREKQLCERFGWAYERTANDVWCFGFEMQNGVIFGVRRILDISDQGFADVEFMEDSELPTSRRRLQGCPTSRTTGSINMSQVLAVYELADT